MDCISTSLVIIENTEQKQYLMGTKWERANTGLQATVLRCAPQRG